jgi:hypothetical protein
MKRGDVNGYLLIHGLVRLFIDLHLIVMVMNTIYVLVVLMEPLYRQIRGRQIQFAIDLGSYGVSR